MYSLSVLGILKGNSRSLGRIRGIWGDGGPAARLENRVLDGGVLETFFGRGRGVWLKGSDLDSGLEAGDL